MSAQELPAFLKEGLIAYYPFNGNAIDETGSGNDGQINGNVTLASDRFGRQSTAFQFDGAAAIDVPTKIPNLGEANYTISAWFCTDNLTQIAQHVFNTSPHNGVHLALYNFSNENMGWNSFFSVGNGNYWVAPDNRGAKKDYENKTWYHLVFTKKQTAFTLYINGNADAYRDVPDTAQSQSSHSGFRIGALTVNQIAEGGFKGRLDDFRVYNRALSESEVKGLYDFESKYGREVPTSPRRATATLQVVNGYVVGVTVTDGGFGYETPPVVLLKGISGSGATAVATVANGMVTKITITNPGSGYTSDPVVRIASPPFTPKVGIEISKVKVSLSVVLGRKYQLEASTDLNTWTPTGSPFIAENEELVQEFDVNQVGRFFRISQVP